MGNTLELDSRMQDKFISRSLIFKTYYVQKTQIKASRIHSNTPIRRILNEPPATCILLDQRTTNTKVAPSEIRMMQHPANRENDIGVGRTRKLGKKATARKMNENK